MLMRTSAFARAARRAVLAVLALAVAVVLTPAVHAQVFSNQRSVGGVKFDTDGMIQNISIAERGQIQREVLDALAKVPADLSEKCQTRKVSLKRLDAALRECAASGKAVPDEIQCLAGLQQIQYVLAYPEHNDIVLVGPAEGWKIAADGTVIGQTTGRPVLLLDDLIVALRAVSSPNPTVIACSIDPSEEGRQRLQRMNSRSTNPQQAAAALEAALGPQVISVDGIPANSHFAAVLVAADYRMKQIGIGLTPSPVRQLPSFVEMLRAKNRKTNQMPRWWLEPDYGTILGDEEGLAWQITEAGVKTMTENDLFTTDGGRKQTGKSDPLSQKWAETMTACYADLSIAEPVFGQLQGCMDLAVAAALIVRKDLSGKAGCQLPMLFTEQSTAQIAAPRHVASRATYAQINQGWVIACGGVQVNPWAIVERSAVNADLAQLRRQTALAADGSWWSN
ncbi:MAG: DUF1598 domain-containing protein [Thermoguttaceae bacterium]